MQTIIEKILACPQCKGSISENDKSQIVCNDCGVVGRVKFGIYDFLFNRKYLDVAGQGKFDLTEDEEKADFIESQLSDLNFLEARDFLAQQNMADQTVVKDDTGFIKANAIERQKKRYAKMEAEIGLKAGESIMNRVNPYLTDKGYDKLGGETALEAGGGQGLHLPSFAQKFDNVAFLDCSLINLLMGIKLAKETGVADKIILVRGDATLLPFKDKSMDFVHEAGVIEHVDEPRKLVSEALRVISNKGTYVCLSPNKYPISPEPHYNLPLFGIFPRKIRKYIIATTRGKDSEAGTELLSLTQLKQSFRSAGEKNVDIYFLPRKLPETTRKTFIRRFVHSAFQLPLVGSLTSFVLNKLLLFIMPYHIAVISRQKKTT